MSTVKLVVFITELQNGFQLLVAVIMYKMQLLFELVLVLRQHIRYYLEDIVIFIILVTQLNFLMLLVNYLVLKLVVLYLILLIQEFLDKVHLVLLTR